MLLGLLRCWFTIFARACSGSPDSRCFASRLRSSLHGTLCCSRGRGGQDFTHHFLCFANDSRR